MSVLVLLAILLCLVIAAWSWMRQDADMPPDMPGAIPIIGHSLQMLGDRKHLWSFLQGVQENSLREGGIVRFWLGPHSIYMITDPEDSLTVANTCLSKPYVYDFAIKYLGTGLITAKESLWKTHRKLLNPAFNQQVLNTYVNEMNMQSRKLVSQLASKVEKEPFDVREFIMNFTLSTVTRTSLGLNTHDQTLIDTDYVDAIDELSALYCDRFQKVWLHLSYLFDRSAMKCKESVLLKKLKNIIEPVIQKRKSELKTNKNPNLYSDPTQGKFEPVLDQMLQMADEQDAFTDEDIRSHLDTLVAAAYDTTSSAMTFMLIVIGSEKDVQERMFNEIKEVLEHEDDDLTKHDLTKLVYLEAVIKETMRMYPAVPMIGRKLDKDVKLKNYTLRAGNTALLGVCGLLCHPMWGADARQFRPERWLNSAELPDHPSLYAGFGVGKRNCIGKQYSMMAMKTALAHILRRYHVSGNINNVVCEFNIVSKPIEGHHISITRRT